MGAGAGRRLCCKSELSLLPSGQSEPLACSVCRHSPQPHPRASVGWGKGTQAETSERSQWELSQVFLYYAGKLSPSSFCKGQKNKALGGGEVPQKRFKAICALKLSDRRHLKKQNKTTTGREVVSLK